MLKNGSDSVSCAYNDWRHMSCVMFINDWRHISCTRIERVSTSRPVTLHFVSWWGKSALYHRMFPLLNIELTGNMTYYHIRSQRGSGTHWRSLVITFENHYIGQWPRRKRLYDIKAVNRKFPVGSWVLRYYPPASLHKLGSPWIWPNQVIRQATGHTVGIQWSP